MLGQGQKICYFGAGLRISQKAQVVWIVTLVGICLERESGRKSKPVEVSPYLHVDGGYSRKCLRPSITTFTSPRSGKLVAISLQQNQSP